MSSIIYNPEVRRFSVVETRSFDDRNLPKIINSDWNNKLTPAERKQFLDIKKEEARINWAKKHNVQIERSNNNRGNNQSQNGGNNKDKNKNNDKKDEDKNRSGNHWTKNSPKVYAYEKLLNKNLEQLRNDNKVKDFKKLDDSYAVELPGDVWINIYCTADGSYVITKLDMGDGGYLTSSRRFNAVVAGPKELRNIISNLQRLDEPGLLRSLILRGVGFITGTDLVDKIKFKLW